MDDHYSSEKLSAKRRDPSIRGSSARLLNDVSAPALQCIEEESQKRLKESQVARCPSQQPVHLLEYILRWQPPARSCPSTHFHLTEKDIDK